MNKEKRNGKRQRHHEEEALSPADKIMELIINLNRERIQFESGNDFISAGQVKEQLRELGEEFKQVSLLTIRDRQKMERESLEQQYEEELEQKAIEWDHKLQENENYIQEVMEKVIQTQEEEIQVYENDLRQNMPPNKKASKDVLNTEYQIRKLVKKQRYKEAAILQKKLHKLRMKCEMKGAEETNDKIRKLLENLIKKQENDRMAIELKLNLQRDELLSTREKEFDAIHSKFNVFREKLESNHNNEFLAKQKDLKSFNPSSNHLIQEYLN